MIVPNLVNLIMTTIQKLSSLVSRLLIFIPLMLFIAGCESDEVSKGPDVYLAGYEGHEAKYWKNGIGVALTSIGDYGLASASSIVVSGNDVYVAGNIYSPDPQNPEDGPVFWKNGTPFFLPSGTRNAYTSSITISGNDVYVAGAEDGTAEAVPMSPSVAKYWKNGEEVILTPGWANSIFVIGGDVYVAGVGYNGTGLVATYWKNGVPAKLGDGTTDSHAYGIVVSGGDVYVVGTEGNEVKYWKNGIDVVLPGGHYANSIAVSGNDVYVSGGAEIYGIMESHSVAVYWKNANMVRLSNDSDISNASAIAVLDNNVYVAGRFRKTIPAFLRGEPFLAASWTNGAAEPITDGKEDAFANSIFIVR